MKIEKTVFQSKTRKLNKRYTVEQTQDIENLLSDTLQKAIDKEIIETILIEDLKEKGWIKIPVTVWHPLDMESWFEEFIKDEYQWFTGCIMFKDHDDAVLYSLRWS